ncbi:transmembrane protein 238-like [Podarcis raffonei]|uniref:transmembrane protein 238-like n=1 Tax=Podarcis raffonei TaxID=65483 RepID=UPI00232984EA|nr:transmembrane protein 238-like [Podarcis raffonei]
MGHARCGHCAVFLVAALVLDGAGLALVLAGAVGRPTVDGIPLEDFLVLTGSLLLALSLLCWLFWYSGNLRGVPAEELQIGGRPAADAAAAAGTTQPRRRQSLLRLAAKLSERLSQRRRPAPAPCAPLGSGLPAKATRGAAAGAGAAGPLELSCLRPAAPLEQGPARTQERLV